jgi:murein L,D-transpeptidase YcbB/YkuD
MGLTMLRSISGFAVAIVIGAHVLAAPVMAASDFSLERQAVAEAAWGNDALVEIYRARNYGLIWLDGSDDTRLPELIHALSQAHLHALPVARYDYRELQAAIDAATTPQARAEADVLASRMFMQYAQDINSGLLTPREVDSDIVITLPRRDHQVVFSEFLESNPREYLASLAPQNPEYSRILDRRFDLLDIAARGGYGPEISGRTMRPGDVGPNVVRLRNRLISMGYMAQTLSTEYDVRLQQAVIEFQQANGLEPDGSVGPATMRALNRTVDDHLAELALALERQRWLNIDRGERHIFVNTTDFYVHVFDDGEITFTTRSVVGANERDRRTPEFSDEMDHMVINPTWYVPRSIALRSYIPDILEGNGTYLQIRYGRRIIDPAEVDWSAYSEEDFPFDLSQPPGPRNALGRVKFMFPNPWNIYLHDTPERYLFSRHRRAYSSGCIRLQDPSGFAYHLLAAQEDNPEQFYQSILRSRDETYVNLDTHVPVHITYWTAWVDVDGQMQLRNDLYGRNGRLIRALRNEGVEFGAISG